MKSKLYPTSCCLLSSWLAAIVTIVSSAALAVFLYKGNNLLEYQVAGWLSHITDSLCLADRRPRADYANFTCNNSIKLSLLVGIHKLIHVLHSFGLYIVYSRLGADRQTDRQHSSKCDSHRLHNLRIFFLEENLFPSFKTIRNTSCILSPYAADIWILTISFSSLLLSSCRILNQ